VGTLHALLEQNLELADAASETFLASNMGDCSFSVFQE
jgi:hypothetical protein